MRKISRISSINVSTRRQYPYFKFHKNTYTSEIHSESITVTFLHICNRILPHPPFLCLLPNPSWEISRLERRVPKQESIKYLSTRLVNSGTGSLYGLTRVGPSLDGVFKVFIQPLDHYNYNNLPEKYYLSVCHSLTTLRHDAF